MSHIPNRLRQQVITRAKGRCEYCQTQQSIVVVMEIDHIQPLSVGGATNLDNLCLACVGCNAFKLNFQSGFDPDTQTDVALFHPRRQQWDSHFQWREDGVVLLGRTATGRATINRLRINRDVVVQARKRWVVAGWHPPST
jgi:hypothetical protein